MVENKEEKVDNEEKWSKNESLRDTRCDSHEEEVVISSKSRERRP